MALLRFKALEIVENRELLESKVPLKSITESYQENVFNDKMMRQYLSPTAYRQFFQSVKDSEPVEAHLADEVASAMKNWAVDRGATHYTHWFHPLTGSTAEKHDAFFTLDYGEPVEEFKGSSLVQQEPDAGSFPSGGIRDTFEARGYTAWDPTSPAFVMESGFGMTLCIPTVFVAYTGEALDTKTPLLKSLVLVNKAATTVCHYFDKSIERVQSTLGCEQEFFLVDKALFDARPDLVSCGRTVFGRKPPKGEQLNDHYFGAIPERVECYLHELEIEAYKLGVPIRTRHNEVAPSQFELTPIHEETNLAIDHNQLLMDVMSRVATRHKFKVLFHEKPFAGLNGSGKHNNWALCNDQGKNLLQPSTRAKENLQFLTFFVNVIMAVYEHADLLRASIASAGNDYRLGSGEAPPPIMSVFIGSQMSAVLEELESNASVEVDKGDNVYMKLGIDKIPPILLDNTDRNRTSPFAFTGNKFELRAVGSSANNASSMTILNLIVADRLMKFTNEVDKQIDAGIKKEVAIINVLREYSKVSKPIRFEGNGYGEDWADEAEKRGLPNVKGTPKALDAYLKTNSKKLFKQHKIMKEPELITRHEIMLDSYIRRLQIDSRMMGDLALNHIVPTAIATQSKLIENVKGLRDVGLDEETGEVIELIQNISKYIRNIKRLSFEMIDARKVANKIETIRSRAIAYEEVKEKYFDEIRWNVDKLELVVADEDWPLPKYRELLFLK